MPHQMTEKEILSTLLLKQKQLAEECNHAASHTDDPQLLQTLTDTIREAQQTRLEIFQAMNARGWYNPQPIQQSQIDQARQNFQSTQQQLQSIVNQRPGSGSGQGFQTSSPQNFGMHGTSTSAGQQHQGFQSQPFQNTGFQQSQGWQGSAFTQGGTGQSGQQGRQTPNSSNP